jgi:hypothetical protein
MPAMCLRLIRALCLFLPIHGGSARSSELFVEATSGVTISKFYESLRGSDQITDKSKHIWESTHAFPFGKISFGGEYVCNNGIVIGMKCFTKCYFSTLNKKDDSKRARIYGLNAYNHRDNTWGRFDLQNKYEVAFKQRFSFGADIFVGLFVCYNLFVYGLTR